MFYQKKLGSIQLVILIFPKAYKSAVLSWQTRQGTWTRCKGTLRAPKNPGLEWSFIASSHDPLARTNHVAMPDKGFCWSVVSILGHFPHSEIKTIFLLNSCLCYSNYCKFYLVVKRHSKDNKPLEWQVLPGR